MHLSVARFNSQLADMGQNMTWARASFCPCRDENSGAAVAGCPVCRSRGTLWSPPVAARAGLSGMKVQREWERFGQYESGDVVVSVGSNTPLYAAGENDRIVFVQSSESFDVVLKRGAADKLPYTVITLDRCFWLSTDRQTIVEGGLPVQSADGLLTWPDGQLAPPTRTQYTLRGRKAPEYFLFKELAMDRSHFGGLALPRRLALRKFDLFGR